MDQKNEDGVAAPVALSTANDITLDEFCTRLSMSDKRVELIGGFAHTEVVAGRTKDAESAFQSRFTEFVNKPV